MPSDQQGVSVRPSPIADRLLAWAEMQAWMAAQRSNTLSVRDYHDDVNKNGSFQRTSAVRLCP